MNQPITVIAATIDMIETLVCEVDSGLVDEHVNAQKIAREYSFLAAMVKANPAAVREAFARQGDTWRLK